MPDAAAARSGDPVSLAEAMVRVPSKEHDIGALAARLATLESNHVHMDRRMEEKRQRLGRIEATLASLVTKEEFKELAETTSEIRDVVISAKGSWRALASIGTIAAALIAAVGSVIAVVLHWFGNK